MLVMVLDRKFNRLTSFDLGDTNPLNFNFLTDQQTYTIADNVMLSTFTATFDKSFDEAQYITLGNYLAFKDEWGKTWCFTINEITNETREIREIYCEDLGLDLLNSSSLTYTANNEQPIEYYINRELYDTGWEIGLNEIKTKRKVDFDTSSTTLKRLQDIATAFDCEIYFDIDFNGQYLSKQRVNIVKQVGVSKPNLRLTNGIEFYSLSKSVNIKELKTAVYAYGANGKDIAGLSYNDGRYLSNYGSNLVVDLKAKEQWNRFPNKSKSDSGYYEMVNTSESEDVNVILADAIKALEEKNEPIATYQATLNYSEVQQNIGIGDYIQLVDAEFNPELFLKARVSSITISRLNPSQNAIEISNAKEIDGGISNKIKSLQNRVDKVDKNNISIEIQQVSRGTSLYLKAKVYRGSQDITSDFVDGEFSWKKYNVAGIPDEEFNAQHVKEGNEIIVDMNEIDRTDYFECTILVYDFELVSLKWFQNGLNTMAHKINSIAEKDSSIVIFGTDLHQALSSAIRSNSKIYRYSNNHIKNMVELTKMVNADLLVLGGDNADGSTSKEQQISALKQIVSTAGQSNCPFLVCQGNHDDNSWYARDLCSNDYDPRNVISPKEMADIITSPVLNQEGVEVNWECRTAYYDHKNIRHIILNSSDVPYTVDSNSNSMFPAIDSIAYSSKQLEWLIDTLKSTPNDYKVCLYEHIPYGNTYGKMDCAYYNVDQFMSILEAFQQHKKVSIKNDDPVFKTDLIADFTENEATIIYGIHGHTHNDKLMKWNNIHFICTGCSAPVPRHRDGTGLLDNRTLQTLNEDLFDVLIYTPSKNQIDILRYGAGKDRQIKL